MLTTLGRGLAPQRVPVTSKCFYLTKTLPMEFSFTRSSTGTYINENGNLVEAASGAPRFDHTPDGKQLGLLIEGAIVNKNTNYNANPTNTTGFNTSGTGTLTVVDDASELAAAGLDQICTSGNVFRAEATTGSAYIVNIPGTTGNTNAHSGSLWARGTGSGSRAGQLSLGSGTVDIAVPDENYARFKLENQTPGSSSDTLDIIVEGNSVVYFILNQLEELTFCTSVIITEGSTASRSADRPYIDNLDTYNWFDPAKGYIACRYYLPALNPDDSYVAVAHDGSTSDTIGIRLDSNDHDARAFLRAGSTLQFTSSNSDIHVPQSLNAAGITWDSSDALLLSGGMSTTTSMTQTPTGIDRLDLGSRNGGSGPLFGHIQMIEIGTDKLDAKQLGAKMLKPSDIILGCAGQSLMRGHFISQESSSEAGKQKHREILNPLFPEKSVVLVNGSTSGSAASKTTDDVNYWWDLTTSSRGPAMDTFYTETDDKGIKPTAILWAQGEADSHDIGGDTSRAEYKQALESIFDDFRATLGPIPVFMQRIGRRTTFSNTGGVQTVREVQQELIDENDWCFDAAEIYDVDLDDQVHPDDAGYITIAQRNALSLADYFEISRSYLGPQITGATRDGTSVTVGLSHDGGNDFTPSDSIGGFAFFDDTSEISISAAVRTNATTITLTLAGTPSSGTETLYYGYDDMNGITVSNIVKDNAATSLPLRTATINL